LEVVRPRRELREDVGVLRRLERDRLDALQVSLWDRAMAGDITAAHEVIQIVRARCRLLGLDLRTKADDTTDRRPVTGRSVVASLPRWGRVSFLAFPTAENALCPRGVTGLGKVCG